MNALYIHNFPQLFLSLYLRPILTDQTFGQDLCCSPHIIISTVVIAVAILIYQPFVQQPVMMALNKVLIVVVVIATPWSHDHNSDPWQLAHNYNSHNIPWSCNCHLQPLVLTSNKQGQWGSQPELQMAIT